MRTMEKSMRLGSELIESVWERMRPKEFAKLREGKKENIVVIDGSYDSLEEILSSAKIPHIKIDAFPDKKELIQGGKYQNTNVIFVNCDNAYHDNLDEKNLTRENKHALIEYVERGGRLVTTDWAASVVKYLFGKISIKRNVTGDEVVKVNFANEIARELSGIIYGNATPNWWLEGSSDMVSYRADSGIINLVESEQMKKKYGSKNISLGFKYGGGEVFHFVSHLKAQRIENYDARDRQSLGTFLDDVYVPIKGAKKSKITFGEIETTYTLMNTVLELCRNANILGGKGK